MTPTKSIITYPEHEARTCGLCEKVPPHVWRRHWKLERPRSLWHVIADGPDLMSRLPKSAHFVTILSYLPGPDDQLPHYQGPLYAEADGPCADVLRDLRRCVEVLTVEYDCPAEAVRLWLSGGRSVHLTIPASVIGADEGHPLLPESVSGDGPYALPSDDRTYSGP